MMLLLTMRRQAGIWVGRNSKAKPFQDVAQITAFVTGYVMHGCEPSQFATEL